MNMFKQGRFRQPGGHSSPAIGTPSRGGGGGGEMNTSRPTTGRRRGRVVAVSGALSLLLAVTLTLTLLVPQNTQAAGDVSVGTKGIVLAWDELSPLEDSTTASEVMLRLGTQPTGTVTVALSGSANTNGTTVTCTASHKLCIDSTAGGTKSNTSLTFTTLNWDTPQTFDIYAQADTDQLDESITLTLTPSGGGYGSSEAATVDVTIRDGDKNQFAFTGLTNSNRDIEVDEGASKTFTVALSGNPASTVTVAITSSNSMVSVSPTSLTFTSTTGTTAQTVTITAGSDPNTEDEEYYLRLVPSGSTDTRTRGYSITVTVDDQDTTADLTVSETSLSLNESGSGNTDTFDVSLATAPAAGKDVLVAIGVHGANGKRIATADKNKLTFTSTTYNTAQTVTITGVADNDGSNDTGTVRVVATQDGPFSGLSRSIPLTVTDTASDTGIVVTRNGAAVSSITAGPGTVYASVRLPYQPSGDVTVAVAGAGPVSASFAGGSSTATFTSRNWDQSQGLTITIGSGSIDASGVNIGFLPGGGGYTAATIKVYGLSAPTATIGSLNANNAITVTFSKAVGPCSTKTATSAAERVCSGTVTAFTNADVDDEKDLFEIAVEEFAPDFDPPAGTSKGAPVAYTATVSGNVVTITPTAISRDGPDIPLVGTARKLTLLVKDRYWSVNGKVIGATVAKTFASPGAGQALAQLNHTSNASAFILVGIDPAKARGAAGNSWSIKPQRAFPNDTLRVVASDPYKELRVRFATGGSTTAEMVTAINAVSGFTVVGSGGPTVSWSWLSTDTTFSYPEVPFAGGGADAGARAGGFGSNSPPPPVTPTPPEPPVLLGLQLLGGADDDDDELPEFDGWTYELKHVTDDSTACLDVSYGLARDGQDVWTWACNGTDAQQWTLEKRTAGAYKDSYRLVNKLGDGAYCLDNRGDFATSQRMAIGTCVADTHADAANQSVTIAAAGDDDGDGYTLTFSNGSQSSWLSTDRTSNNVYGGANQTTVSGAAGDSAHWQLEINFNGQTLEVQHVTDASTACLDVTSGTASNGQDVGTAACADANADAQQWTFEKRTAGTYRGAYRLVSKLGNYCLDNRDEFVTSDRMGIWGCVGDTHSAAARQSVAVAAEGEGYTLTFTSGSNRAWLTTDRANATPQGGAGQTTVTDTASSAAIWRIVQPSDD